MVNHEKAKEIAGKKKRRDSTLVSRISAMIDWRNGHARQKSVGCGQFKSNFCQCWRGPGSKPLRFFDTAFLFRFSRKPEE